MSRICSPRRSATAAPDGSRRLFNLGHAGVVGREGGGITQAELCAIRAGQVGPGASGKNQASGGHRLTEITPCQLSGHRARFL